MVFSRRSLASLWLVVALPTTDPSFFSARYFFENQRFSEALPLWRDVRRRNPKNVPTVLRVAELRLWVDGRADSGAELREFANASYGLLTRDERELLKREWRRLQSVFVTENGQSLHLRAEEATRRKDYALALSLLEQIPSADQTALSVLRLRAQALRLLADARADAETAKFVSAYPFDETAWLELAPGLRAQGKGAELIANFELFPDVFSANRELRAEVARAYEQQGRAGFGSAPSPSR